MVIVPSFIVCCYLYAHELTRAFSFFKWYRDLRVIIARIRTYELDGQYYIQKGWLFVRYFNEYGDSSYDNNWEIELKPHHMFNDINVLGEVLDTKVLFVPVTGNEIYLIRESK